MFLANPATSIWHNVPFNQPHSHSLWKAELFGKVPATQWIKLLFYFIFPFFFPLRCLSKNSDLWGLCGWIGTSQYPAQIIWVTAGLLGRLNSLTARIHSTGSLLAFTMWCSCVELRRRHQYWEGAHRRHEWILGVEDAPHLEGRESVAWWCVAEMVCCCCLGDL